MNKSNTVNTEQVVLMHLGICMYVIVINEKGFEGSEGNLWEGGEGGNDIITLREAIISLFLRKHICS